MNNMASWSKERTLRFIEQYRHHECLWKVKSKEYSNKVKKEKAYDELISFVKSFIPDANKDTVVSKIANLRSSFRKEHKKIVSSQLSGAGDDAVYEPTLFYFETLNFLSDSETPRQGRESYGDTQQSPHAPDMSVDSQQLNLDSQEEDLATINPNADDAPTTGTAFTSPPPTSTQGPEVNITPTIPRHVSTNKKASEKRKRLCPEDNLLLMACEKLNESSSENSLKDDHDCFGQTVASDLRKMTRNQLIHTKKLIFDVLYEGQLGNLSRACRVYIVPEGNTAQHISWSGNDPHYVTSDPYTETSQPSLSDVYRSYP